MINDQKYKKIEEAFRVWYSDNEEIDITKMQLYDTTMISDYDKLGECFTDEGFLDSEGNLTEKGKAALSVCSPDESAEPDAKPGLITAEEWEESGYYAARITSGKEGSKDKKYEAVGYDEYVDALEYFEEEEYSILSVEYQTPADYFPGLLTYEAAVSVFAEANEKIIEMRSFPEFCKTAKIQVHDSVVLAADTGAGKSSLVINFLNQLNDDYPVLYINLEMDKLTIMRRLAAIRTGVELDRIEGYQNDEHTADFVNSAMMALTRRKPLQIIDDLYSLKEIESHIKHAARGREEPTIVIIDHALLVKGSKKSAERYARFTEVSEELRRMTRENNIIMFALLQQNRDGKKDTEKRPTNSSLKESGSWENDATHIVFLWWDPAINSKRLIMTKNRHGQLGEFVLNYWPETQTYKESAVSTQTVGRAPAPARARQSSRDKRREKLSRAIEDAMILTMGNATLFDVAECAGVAPGTIKSWAKEFGGVEINGVHYDPEGVADVVEQSGFVAMTPHQQNIAKETMNDQDPEPIKEDS